MLVSDIDISLSHATLFGICIHLTVSSIFWGLEAKDFRRRFGYVFCTGTLGILMLSCWQESGAGWPEWLFGFFGFAAVSVATNLDAPTPLGAPTLTTDPILRALRQARTTSSMVLSLNFFVFAGAFGAGLDGNIEVLPLALTAFCLVACISMLVEQLLWPSRLTGFFALMGALALVLISSTSFARITIQAGTFVDTLLVATCLGLGVNLWNYGGRLRLLSLEQLLLARPTRQWRVLSLRNSLSRPGVHRLRALASWSLDLIARLILAAGWQVKLFIVGALMFTIAATYLALYWKLNTLGAGPHLESPSRDGNTSDLGLLVNIVALHISLLAVIGTLYWASAAIRRASRSISVASALNVRREDSRPPILFLRSFADDAGALPSRSLIQRLWNSDDDITLDHLLVSEFESVGPPIAIGDPREGTLVYGAARSFVGETWQATVESYSREAHAILIVCSRTDSVTWELSLLQEASLRRKTLFLLDPSSDVDAGLERDDRLSDLLADVDAKGVVAAYRRSDQTRAILATGTRLADHYLIACRAFFNELSTPEPCRAEAS